MGLDMYAARKLYTKQWEHQKPEERYTVQIDLGGQLIEGIDLNRISEVSEEVMYWRKANHIHAWFVDNVQGGKDDCGEYEVGDDDLRELLKVCQKVIRGSKLVDGMVYAGKVFGPGMDKPEEQREPGKLIEDSTVAEKLLPTQVGPFVGCYEYDEEYLNDVKATADWAKRMLADSKAGVPGYICYSSSW